MSTLFTNIFERFAMKTKDYTLDKLYTSSVDDYNEYLTGFLLNAIPKFNFECTVDLSDRDDVAMVFNNTLSELDEEILAEWITLEWVTREVNKLEHLQRTLGDSDFKLHSGANSLKECRNLKSSTREDLDSLITQYSWESAFDEGS